MSAAATAPSYVFDEDAQATIVRARAPLSPKAESASYAARVVVDRHDGREQNVAATPLASSRVFEAAPELRPIAHNKTASFTVAKEWEGVVESIGISHFMAQLREIGSTDDATEVAELPIGDIPAGEREKLREGAVFRYLIGYAQHRTRTVTRKRLVYFRRGRLPQDSSVEAEWLSIAAMFTDD